MTRWFLGLLLTLAQLAAARASSPDVEIGNGSIQARIALPDAKRGFYRGTRFDWSGVVRSLSAGGHEYYGEWFTKTDPQVHDFIYQGDDIVAGPCSAITGPVEEFSSGDKGLGYDLAPAGGTFLKIGVGVLRKPDAKDYDRYRLYELVDGGTWKVHPTADSVEFLQTVRDPSSGYAYEYTKVIKLIAGKPEMEVQHRLKNSGPRPIATSVYDHNFLVLDKQPIGPSFRFTTPFPLTAEPRLNPEMAVTRDRQFTYGKKLEGRDTVAATFTGYGDTAKDYDLTVENTEAGAGVRVTGNRPLSRLSLWSIRSVLSVEPFLEMQIEPGKEFTWTYHYTYYRLQGDR